MPVITLDRFELGIDLRKGDSVSDANRLRDLRNAYITAGWAIQKRPGLRRVLDLSQGSVGMLSFDNGMHTFSGSSNPLHASNDELEVTNHVVLNPDNVSLDVERILYSDVFNGIIYVVVRYDDGSIKHHYLDDHPDWRPGTNYEEGDVVSGVSNGDPGVYYRCIDAGTSGGAEPTWPDIFSRPPAWEPNKAYDPDALVKPTGNATSIYTTTAAGTSGATEPVWADGVTDNDITWDFHGSGTEISDGTVVWEPITTAIDDPNCPHSESAIVLGSKVYAIDGEVTRFSATEDPTDWTTEDDAGFLPTGTRAPGSPTALALGDFQGNLVVFMDDSVQVWAVDPDPQRDTLTQIIGNVGTHYPKSVNKVGDDLYFLSDVGFRSVAQQKFTTNLEDVDVGTAIDPLVRPIIKDLPDIDVQSIYYAGGGQYACAVGETMFVYSFSRTSKVSAWSYYELPNGVEALETLGAKLYVRIDDVIYHADDDYYTDDGDIFTVSGRMAYQSFKKPGVMKQVYGCDVVFEGEAITRHKYDARSPDENTPWVRLEGDSRPGPLVPVEVMTTEVAFEFENKTDQDFRLDSVAYHYHELDTI